MHIDPWILTFSALTVIATIWMGFWSARRSKTAHDFYVAGRSVSVGWNASAISGEYLSAASFMGVAGMVMSSGYDALWYPVCYACGYLFLLLFIAGPLRRFGAYTIPDFAEGRYDSPLFRKIAVVFVLFIGFFYTMPQMKGAGTTLAYIFPGLPYWAGVVLVGAVITLNVALGGMKGITLVQAFQYWAKMFAISLPIFVLMAVYGHYGKQVNLNRDEIPIPRAQSVVSAKSLVTWSPGAILSVNGKNDIVTVLGATAKEKLKAFLNQPAFASPLRQAAPEDVFYAYTDLLQTTVQVDPDLQSIQTRFDVEFDNSQQLTRKQHALHMQSVLRTNPVMILVECSNQMVFAFTSNVLWHTDTVARRILPATAPADSTWLSPFGPLTTKAAKAAESKLRAESIDEVFTELDYSFPSALANAHEFLKTHVLQPELAFGKHSLAELLVELRRARKLPVLVSATVRSSAANWLTNEVEITTTGSGRAKEIESGFAASNIGIILSSKVTLVVPLARKAEFQKIYDRNGIAPFVNGPIDEKALKTRQKTYSLLYTYSLIIALVCGTAGLPHILVRFYTNPDGVAAKRTTMWVMILIGIFYVFPPVFGVMGRNLLPELYAGVGAKGTDKVVLELPRILNEPKVSRWESEKVGTFTNAAALSPAHSPTFPPAGTAATKASGIPWGSILSGITCAGAFAAFMSTFSGLLVSMTGALAHDVYGRMFRPKSTPEQRLRAFKVCTVLIGGIAIVLGCFVEPLEINFMVGQAFAIAAASYFPLLFMSVWWRGMTMRGAATGMLTGGLCALAAVTLTNVSNLALDKGPMGKVFSGFAPLNPFWAGHPLLRILCEQPAIWTVPLAIGLMIVIGKLTNRTVPPDTRMKMLVLHAPEQLGLKQEYIQEHHQGH